MRARCTLLGIWLSDIRYFSILSRLAGGALVALWMYQAYVLGWTRILVGSVTGGSAWGERDRYAAQGISSLSHLSATNIGRAVMVVPLVALISYLVFKPRALFSRGLLARCIFIASALFLGLFSFINSDIPFNFYGSRYYLPEVVPLLMISYGLIVSGWGAAFRRLAIAAIIIPAVYFSAGLINAPAYQGNIEFVTSLAERSKNENVVFLVGSRALAQSMQLPLMTISRRPVIFIDSDKVSANHLQQLVDSYLEALGGRTAALISSEPLSFMQKEEGLNLSNTSIPFNISYETRQRALMTQRISLGIYESHNALLVNRAPQWVVGGVKKIPYVGRLSEILKENDITVRTGGGWLWATQKGGLERELSLTVGGVAMPLVRQNGNDFVFSSPTLVQDGEMIIRSSTFVPSRLGINADKRELGIDLLSVRLLPKAADTQQPPLR